MDRGTCLLEEAESPEELNGAEDGHHHCEGATGAVVYTVGRETHLGVRPVGEGLEPAEHDEPEKEDDEEEAEENEGGLVPETLSRLLEEEDGDVDVLLSEDGSVEQKYSDEKYHHCKHDPEGLVESDQSASGDGYSWLDKRVKTPTAIQPRPPKMIPAKAMAVGSQVSSPTPRIPSPRATSIPMPIDL